MKRLFPTTWVSIILALLLFPVGIFLPPSWGWQNGPLENTQVLILSIGLVLSWFASQHNQHNRNARNLWLWLTLFWFLCIGRELSWGRVFYFVAVGDDGPEFLSIHQLWYGPWVHPLIVIVVIAMLMGICCSSPLKYLRQKKLPFVDIAILFTAVALAGWFEKTTMHLLQPYKVLLEEWFELIAYWSMVSIEFITGLKTGSTQPIKTGHRDILLNNKE